jgi:hypothetical protein
MHDGRGAEPFGEGDAQPRLAGAGAGPHRAVILEFAEQGLASLVDPDRAVCEGVSWPDPGTRPAWKAESPSAPRSWRRRPRRRPRFPQRKTRPPGRTGRGRTGAHRDLIWSPSATMSARSFAAASTGPVSSSAALSPCHARLRYSSTSPWASLRQFGRHGTLGQNGHAGAGDVGEAAQHHVVVGAARMGHRQDAGAQRRDGRRVVGHGRHVAVRAGHAHLARLERGEAPFGADEIELQGCHMASGCFVCPGGGVRPPPYRDPCPGRASGGFGGQTLGLGDHLVDAADHVEGRFGQVVVLAGHHAP